MKVITAPQYEKGDLLSKSAAAHPLSCSSYYVIFLLTIQGTADQ